MVAASLISRRAVLLAAAGAAVAGCARKSPLPSALPTTKGVSPPMSPTSPGYLAFVDNGPLMVHGTGPDGCDRYGSREAIAFTDGQRFYLHYDGAGPDGWLACLASSDDGTAWTKHGPVLDLGAPGRPDSASASSPWVVYSGNRWLMFYLGTRYASPAPNRIPQPPYVTCLAEADHPTGPWRKRYDVTPFTTKPGSYFAVTASPGAVLKHDGEWLQFFSASSLTAAGLRRTLGIARTSQLDGTWSIDPAPALPLSTDIENSSVYYEPSDGGWYWLFTNRISEATPAHTDAAIAYWSRNPTQWDTRQCAVVVDTKISTWSRGVIGMPSVLPMNGKLAVFYDGFKGSDITHMGRDIGWGTLPLPLVPPTV